MGRLGQHISYFIRKFNQDRCTVLAASLTFSMILTIVPYMLVGVTILSYFPKFQNLMPILQKFIFDNFLANSGGALMHSVQEFMSNINQMDWINVLASAVTSVFLLYNMVDAFNIVWGVKFRAHMGLSFLMYFLFLIVCPVLFGLILFVFLFISSLSLFGGGVMRPLTVALPYITAFFGFTFFQWVLPSCRVKLRYASIAGFFTTVFFEMARYIFSLYLKFFPSYQLIYGALAAIPILLMWIYLSWLIILCGAELCCMLQKERKIQ